MLQFEQLQPIIKKNLIVTKFSAKGLWGAEWTKYCMAHLSASQDKDI